MGRKSTWRRRYRRLPLAASLVPIALTLSCLAGLVRLRPLIAGSTGFAAALFGFLVGAALLHFGGKDSQPRTLAADVPGIELVETATAQEPEPQPLEALRLPPEPGARPAKDQVVYVGKGDTLLKLITEVGVDKAEAHEAIAALREVYDPKRLRVGQAIKVTYTPPGAGDANSRLVGMRLEKSYDREAGAGRLADGRFEPFEVEKQLDLRTARASGIIQNSLFEDGAAEGVPAKVMVEFIRLFSYDVDFQRDIHAGDSFDLLFERYHGDEGQVAHEGEITFASLTVAGSTLRLYRYETFEGEVDYYNEKGESARKALLRTPVDGARLTSGFGMRRHPILGYSKMHRGVDFAVPSGTPIVAAGNGTIEFVGRKGGSGKYIQLRHNGQYSTAYAHMQDFANGMTRGRRVKQGEVIGYVGSTGRSTGPHLHYEVLEGGDQINPMNLKLPSGTQLAGKDLMRFRIAKKRIEERLDRMPTSTLIAQAPGR